MILPSRTPAPYEYMNVAHPHQAWHPGFDPAMAALSPTYVNPNMVNMAAMPHGPYYHRDDHALQAHRAYQEAHYAAPEVMELDNGPITPITPASTGVKLGSSSSSSEDERASGFMDAPATPLSSQYIPLLHSISSPNDRNRLNISKIEEGSDTRTTVMIKNIPNKLSSAEFFAYINAVCPRRFDFMYLRMDFANCGFDIHHSNFYVC